MNEEEEARMITSVYRGHIKEEVKEARYMTSVHRGHIKDMDKDGI